MNSIFKGTCWVNSEKIYVELNLLSYFKKCLFFFLIASPEIMNSEGYTMLFCICASLLKLHFLWRKYGLFLMVQSGQEKNTSIYYAYILMSNTNKMMLSDVLRVLMKMPMNFHQFSMSFSFTLNNSRVSLVQEHTTFKEVLWNILNILV